MNKDMTKKIFLLVTYAVLLGAALFNAQRISSLFEKVSLVMSPIGTGLFLAFFLDVPVAFFKRSVFHRMKNDKLKRGLSIALTYLLGFLLLAAIAVFMVPSIVNSLIILANGMPQYLEEISAYLEAVLGKTGISFEISLRDAFTGFDFSAVAQSMATVLETLKTMSGLFVRFTLGIALSVYLLISKEKLLGLTKRIFCVFIKPPRAAKFHETAKLFNSTFKRFISGQVLEAAILGMLCFIGMALIRLPYSALISLIVGVTAIVPILGAYIGIIPSALILLTEKPIYALVFIIYIVALQQFEGSVIYPKIVGDAIGIDGVFVFIGIILGMGIGGLRGILLGVPFMAFLYALIAVKIRQKERAHRKKE
ncbi:MAG: AI-2E family transporter [Oscillospiraceae bacterium]